MTFDSEEKPEQPVQTCDFNEYTIVEDTITVNRMSHSKYTLSYQSKNPNQPVGCDVELAPIFGIMIMELLIKAKSPVRESRTLEETAEKVRQIVAEPSPRKIPPELLNKPMDI